MLINTKWIECFIKNVFNYILLNWFLSKIKNLIIQKINQNEKKVIYVKHVLNDW